jgi:hypothetical protein
MCNCKESFCFEHKRSIPRSAITPFPTCHIGWNELCVWVIWLKQMMRVILRSAHIKWRFVAFEERRRRRSFQHQEYVALPSSFQSTNVQVVNVCQKLQEGVSIKRSLRGSLTNGDNRKGDQYSRQNEQWKVFPDIVNSSPFPFLMYQKKVLTETTTAKPPLPEGMRKSIPS